MSEQSDERMRAAIELVEGRTGDGADVLRPAPTPQAAP